MSVMTKNCGQRQDILAMAMAMTMSVEMMAALVLLQEISIWVAAHQKVVVVATGQSWATISWLS